MKKLYLILLMLLLLFIPTSVNAVAIYQLDQPIKELDNYTLRQVFTNRNMARPDLTGKTEIFTGVYRLHNANGITIDYNINTGINTINGTSTTTFEFIYTLFNNVKDNFTFSYQYVGGSLVSGEYSPYLTPLYYNYLKNIVSDYQYNKVHTYDYTTNGLSEIRLQIVSGSIFDNLQFKLQLEHGSLATPYQVPTSGPYNQFDFAWLDLTSEQIQTYYDLYLEAVRFEQENIEASQDNGGYQNIFKAIINGVKNLMVEMGFVWSWLNAPLITSDMTSYSFNIDWSWDLIGVVRQILNSAGIITMQILFIVPSLAFSFMGIPVHVSILSLLFSNLIFLLLGWIMVKSFLI